MTVRLDVTREQVLAVAAFLAGGERMPYGEVGRALGVDPNMLRYAAPTGTVLMRWRLRRRRDVPPR